MTNEEIEALTRQGCRCADWSRVQVADPFDARRVQNAEFSGAVRLGSTGGTLSGEAGTEKPCGIYHAALHNCSVGDSVRIANVGVHLANYRIGSHSLIENVGTLETRPGATFGNGVEIELVNEGGGREVVLFNRLNSQFAYLLCLHRYRTETIEKLQAIARAEAEKARADQGTIGRGARISNAGKIVDVNLGEGAVVDGASLLHNGTLLSSIDAPTLVGSDVQAKDFIIAEASQVSGGAVIDRCYIGQGCRIGKQFSCEGSLFFANCEGFHGEACSVFAGPYTVTHHKSTLLIAGLFSFYNAGSGTNQSNHLYKLGPVHEGKLERGCKTGSFSYLMWPCRVGPFSVVLGKHTGTFDTGNLPFSYIEANPAGRCLLTPGFNLTTVGTMRDGAKWPARDRRKGAVLRDRISFDVFSPFTVGRMMAAAALLSGVYAKTERSVESVTIQGAEIKRVLLNTGRKFYRSAIQMYLLDKLLSRVEAAGAEATTPLGAHLAGSPEAVFSEDWLDIGGQLMPRARLEQLCAAIEQGAVPDVDAFEAELDQIEAAYAGDEWAWVARTYCKVFETDLSEVSAEQLRQAADLYRKTRGKFLRLVLNDANKEFSDASHTGFGQDGTPDDVAADFTAVRGRLDTNKFVEQLKGEIEALEDRVDRFKQRIFS